jgi:hypothetical protein
LSHGKPVRVRMCVIKRMDIHVLHYMNALRERWEV